MNATKIESANYVFVLEDGSDVVLPCTIERDKPVRLVSIEADLSKVPVDAVIRSEYIRTQDGVKIFTWEAE